MNRRKVVAWSLFDFANSAFTTLVVTFIYATYFTKGIVGDETLGTALWSRGISATAILVALLSPIVGAMADRGGYRKRFLGITTIVCVLATSALFWVKPGQITAALVIFVIANVAFELGLVFYNAFLPDIADESNIGRISGYGWALGYVGGLACMVIALFAFVQTDTPLFGLAKDGEHVRATNLLVAAWFAVFAIPIFLTLPESQPTEKDGTPLLQATWGQLRRTFTEIRQYRQVVRFLLARLLYNDGLVTVFAFGAIYAQGTFGFTTTEILMFGILLNVTAGIGAFLMGFLDDRLGGKRTIAISIVGLLVGTAIAVITPSKTVFWGAGVIIGIFVGPNQSASRSLMGRFVPPDKENEFYGFFAFSGKATAFLGPLMMGILTTTFQSQRAGVAAVGVLLVAGLIGLYFVDEQEGMDAARRGTTEP